MHEKFIPKSYNWDAIRRIAILPIEHTRDAAPDPGEKDKSSQLDLFLPDSVVQPLVSEMVKSIKRRDSTIVVLLVDPMATPMSEELYLKLAASATGSDAVMTIRVTDVIYSGASPERPGPYVNGTQLPPYGGKSASTRVRMNFALLDVKANSVIWQIDVEVKESRGGVGGSPDEAQPPGPERLIVDLMITAASWLPFAQVQN